LRQKNALKKSPTVEDELKDMKGHLSQESEILYSFLNVGDALIFPKADIKRQVRN